MSKTNVLSERLSSDGRVTWQAIVSPDRNRLAVRGIVAPSSTETVIEPLSELELRELLEAGPVASSDAWRCECGQLNELRREWCARCSGTKA